MMDDVETSSNVGGGDDNYHHQNIVSSSPSSYPRSESPNTTPRDGHGDNDVRVMTVEEGQAVASAMSYGNNSSNPVDVGSKGAPSTSFQPPSKPQLKPWTYTPYRNCPIPYDVTEMTYEQYVARHYDIEREKTFKAMQAKMQEQFQMMQATAGMLMPPFGMMPGSHMMQMPMSMPGMAMAPPQGGFFPQNQFGGGPFQ